MFSVHRPGNENSFGEKYLFLMTEASYPNRKDLFGKGEAGERGEKHVCVEVSKKVRTILLLLHY